MDEALKIHRTESISLLQHPHFQAQLPFHWQQLPADGIQLLNQNLPEQMFIRVISTGTELPPTLRLLLRDELLTTQKRAMARLAGNIVNVQPQLSDTADHAEARLLGRDDDQQLLLAFLVRVERQRALTVSLYRYSLTDTGTPFDTYAATVFEHFRLTSTD
jgi:hypothetical protein